MENYRAPEFGTIEIPQYVKFPPFGIMMQGDERDLWRGLALANSCRPVTRPFTYCEVGIASGATLAAMTELIEQLTFGDWRAFGVDIKNGWSLDMLTLWERLGGHDEQVEISLAGSLEFFAREEHVFDFILIDGCHEKNCVMLDFRAAEKRLALGGVIAFHDADEVAQGMHVQPHRGEPIGVRAALTELNLLGQPIRAGWKLLADIEADPGSHGVAIFQKVA